MKLTAFSKVLIALAVVGLVIAGKWVYTDSDWIPKKVKESKVGTIEDLPPVDFDRNAATSVVRELPGTDVTALKAREFRAAIMGWNAQSGVAYANGGVVTTTGSLMEENGVKLRLITQNDCFVQVDQLKAFIVDYAANKKNSPKGVHMIALMGDGVPGLISAANDEIKKTLGPEFVMQAFAAFGSSFGEDKFMAAPGADGKIDAESLKGAIIIGVIRDGDWNIAMKFCWDNGIPVNLDEKTYDPNALNWMAATDYIKAAEMFVNAQGETRPIVINGKRVKRDTTVVPSGLVTWTPGDRVAVEKRGGVITYASTKDYSSQMPNTWIACKKWLQDNQQEVEGFILASSLGGDQVKSHGSALTFASQVSATVYGDKSMKAEDWEKAFKGYTIEDRQHNKVEIGGSRTWNLADAADYFGLNGTTNNYHAVYKTFGDLDVESYPELIPSYTPFEEAVNLTYLKNVYDANKDNVDKVGAASVTTFKANEKINEVVSHKAVSIEFVTGSAEISPRSAEILEKLFNSFVIANNLKIEIDGHTDNTGSADINQQLSEARANSVKQWFLSKDRSMFLNRIKAQGFGSTVPVADNNTFAGKQKNRRVEIILGN